MSASPLKFLRAGPPPPKVVLLPDVLFFSRTIPLPAGTPPAEVAAQVELALESMSPFPVAQLYHGYFSPEGAAHALVFAAYRRRFTSEQTAAWADAELVLPTFAALLGGDAAPGSTLILSTPEGLTALHRGAGGTTQIFTEALAPEATEEERLRARDALIRAVGGSTTVLDLPTPPAAEPASSDSELAFRSGDYVSRFPTAVAAALDVRDKAELASLRAARGRDVLFWRVAVGCVASLLLLGVAELALLGGQGFWQKARLAQLKAQKPTIEKIMAAQARAIRIEDLSTKRLLPLEMISLVVPKVPGSVIFTKAIADAKDRDHIIIDAKTDNAGEINPFRTAIESLPQAPHVDISGQRTPPGTSTTTFSASITFKPGSIQPAPKL